ncbi:hypothetical protein ACF0H5_019698 [Mactra antiquata]
MLISDWIYNHIIGMGASRSKIKPAHDGAGQSECKPSETGLITNNGTMKSDKVTIHNADLEKDADDKHSKISESDANIPDVKQKSSASKTTSKNEELSKTIRNKTSKRNEKSKINKGSESERQKRPRSPKEGKVLENGKCDSSKDESVDTRNDCSEFIVVYAKGKPNLNDNKDDNEPAASDDHDGVNQDDVIDKIADANFLRDVLYDIDTIGYYIGHGYGGHQDKSDGNNDDRPSDTDTETEAEKLYDKPKEKEREEEEQEKVEQKEINEVEADTDTFDKFEQFKQLYGTNLQQKPKKKKVSGKQTLVLAKVGNKYKYIAVPAYLPGQRTYNARSAFAKGYMERTANIYKSRRYIQEGK